VFRHNFFAIAQILPHLRANLTIFGGGRLSEDAMTNWDNTDQNGEYNKWANWTMNPSRSSDPLVKYVSALVFVLTAGTYMVGIVA
jgi:hypothetical protein